MEASKQVQNTGAIGIFTFLFLFRYTRLIVHMIGFWLYKPSPIPMNPTVTPRDVTVIIPTVDPAYAGFKDCLVSVLENLPKRVCIVVPGALLQKTALDFVLNFRLAYPMAEIAVLHAPVANKRIQIAEAMPTIDTKLTVLANDHTIWPSSNFLRTAIAPFEDAKIGGVATNKRVRREPHGFGFKSLWNVIGALYLERHNFEIRATNAVDGGIFTISGRTALYRTEILQAQEFLQGFTHEMFFFKLFGPLNADDGNFITRWLVARGWKIKVQYGEDAVIETPIGVYPRFLSQCLRWVRTTWRSNSASLFTDRSVWRAQPWCAYAVYFSSFVNFALFYDALLMYTVSQIGGSSPAKYLAWILTSKLVKLVPYSVKAIPQPFLAARSHSGCQDWSHPRRPALGFRVGDGTRGAKIEACI